MLYLDQVKEKIVKRFKRNQSVWLKNEGHWPVVINLALPSQRMAVEYFSQVGQWIQHWQHYKGKAEICWKTRHWQGLGTHTLPYKLLYHCVSDMLYELDLEKKWQLAKDRFQAFSNRWPSLKESVSKQYHWLSQCSELDFQRMLDLLIWLDKNPHSDLYLRQVPINGIHSKWIEARLPLINELLRSIRHINNTDPNVDFYSLSGLKKMPQLIRIRLLDNHLATQFNGLNDISVPLDQWRNVNLAVKNVYIVENLVTGIAFPAQPDSIVIMGLGYGVQQLANILFVMDANCCYYWGDIDTHGFAILNRARMHIPHLQSMLMDEATLLANRNFWGRETTPLKSHELQALTSQEQALYEKIRDNYFAPNLRLEQEHLDLSKGFALA